MRLRIKIIANHISMGNQLLFTPFLRALKHDKPDTYLTTNSKISYELAPELFDNFDGKADTAVIILPNYKVTFLVKMQGMKTIGFKYRIKGHFVGLFIDTVLTWDWALHEVDNNRQFLDVFNISDVAYKLDLNPAFNLPKPEKHIAVHPGGRFDKRWPAKYFSPICDRLIENGYTVSLFGGPEEMELTREVRSAMKHEVYADYSGMTTLPGIISLLNTCDIFFGNDGGLMHIASALRKPVVAIFGPTDYVKNRAFNEPYWIVVNEVPCRPCYHFAKINCINKKKFQCLEELSVDTVYDKLEKSIVESGVFN